MLKQVKEDTMDSEKLAYLRSKLIGEKMKTLKTLNNMDNMEEYSNMDNYLNELSKYDNHPADQGTETFMREQDEGFKNQLKDLLLEIDDSFVDMKNGRYGICSLCEGEIASARLEVIPYAKTCSKCSEASNSEEKIFESIDDDYITKSSNHPEQIGYDREDALQDVIELDIVPGDPSFSTGDYMGVSKEDDEEDMENVENISQEYYDETLK